jgi:hypothetical protein
MFPGLTDDDVDRVVDRLLVAVRLAADAQ